MRTYTLEPIDTWFFRDGAPFHQGESQLDASGPFPPSPWSAAGALRAALALARGWSGAGRWPAEFNSVLGDGPEDWGALRIQGPLLERSGELLFPAPRHLWARGAGSTAELGLAQVGGPVCCDLGPAVRLSLPSDRAKPAAGWLPQPVFAALLAGQPPLPSDLIPEAELWREEPRTGIARDLKTRAVRQGELYSSRHVRLQPEVKLVLAAAGLPEQWPDPDGAFPVGGESRLGFWDRNAAIPRLAMPLERIAISGRFLLVALTPLGLSSAVCAGRAPLPGFGGARVVAACMDRPALIGGWDSLERRPRPMRSFVPTGTVFFCEVGDQKALAAEIDSLRAAPGLPALGDFQAAGFGCVALGAWEDKESR